MLQNEQLHLRQTSLLNRVIFQTDALGQVSPESGKATLERYQAAKVATETLLRLAAMPRHSEAPIQPSDLLQMCWK